MRVEVYFRNASSFVRNSIYIKFLCRAIVLHSMNMHAPRNLHRQNIDFLVNYIHMFSLKLLRH